MVDSTAQRDAIWSIVALEASAFYSMPAWFEIAAMTWPATDPGAFLTAVVGGAYFALVLCHVAPAHWGRRSAGKPQRRARRVAGLLITCWLVGGAVFSVSGNSRITGGVLYPRYVFGDPADSLCKYGAWVWMGVWSALAVAIATSGSRVRKIAGIGCCVFGLGLLISVFTAQSGGLWTRNPRMVGEPHGDPGATLGAILTVAAPGAILAFQLGRAGASLTQIWRTGIVGVAVPIVVASTLAAIAQMCGARLYWGPSFTVDFMFALAVSTDPTLAHAVWIVAAATSLGSGIVSAAWVAAGTANWTPPWKRPLVAVAAAGGTLAIEIFDLGWPIEAIYYRPWVATIVTGSAALGLWLLFQRLRGAG